MSINATDLEKDVHCAQSILSFFTGKGQDIKKLIPPSVLAKAHGIVFIRLYRVGFLVSAKGGTGIIIARLPDGSWSAPSGVSLTSVGFGHQAGGEIIDSIIVMNYRGAVKAFFDAGGQLQLGIAVSIAAGPLGRSADVSASASSMNHIAATYAYSSSKGLFVGYSFEGSKISERVKTNTSFYGRQISAREILTGAVAPPQMAAGLYNILYSIGAAGPQPGVTFGPVRSLSMGSPSPQQHQQQQYQQHPATASPTNNGSFYASKDSYSQGTSAPSPNSPYAPTTTPNGYPLEKSQQYQQQHNYGNSRPYHRESLQPSLSIRNPPQLNPRHSVGDVGQYQRQPPHTRTPDAAASSTDFAEPPPPYEPSQSSNASHGSSSPVTPSDSKQTAMTLPSSSPVQQPQSQHNQHRPLIDASSSPSPVAATIASPISTIQNQGLPATGAPSASSSSPITATQQPSPITDPISNVSSFVVVAKYDFNGQEQGDLPFKTGDHITVTQWTEDRESWWQGKLGTKTGCFPANYTNNL
ncbi:unnamed protein product [Absidia cylindrospora]